METEYKKLMKLVREVLDFPTKSYVTKVGDVVYPDDLDIIRKLKTKEYGAVWDNISHIRFQLYSRHPRVKAFAVCVLSNMGRLNYKYLIALLNADDGIIRREAIYGLFDIIRTKRGYNYEYEFNRIDKIWEIFESETSFNKSVIVKLALQSGDERILNHVTDDAVNINQVLERFKKQIDREWIFEHILYFDNNRRTCKKLFECLISQNIHGVPEDVYNLITAFRMTNGKEEFWVNAIRYFRVKQKKKRFWSR